MAEAETAKAGLEQRLDPLEKDNAELRTELETLKEELEKTEDVERQVKDVLEKFEGILKTSEADNKRLRAELAETAALREQNEALKLYVQKATVMVTEERAKNLELNRLLEQTGTGHLAVDQSRSTAEAMRESLRSRKSTENAPLRMDPSKQFDEDQEIKEATEDEENEASASASNSKNFGASRDQVHQVNVNLEGPTTNKKSAPTSKRTANNPSLISQTPLKQTASSQNLGKTGRATPSVKVADSTDFRTNQKPVQLKKQPNPVVVRGSQATDLDDYYTEKLQNLREAAESSDDAGDELYSSGIQRSARGLAQSSNFTQPSQDQLMELLEQNKQLKMMNQLLHSSQKQLLESKQQHLEQTLSKVSVMMTRPWPKS